MHQRQVSGEDPQLEVAPVIGLGAEPSASQIGAAKVELVSVQEQDLAVKPFAATHLDDTREMFEGPLKRYGRLTSVEDADITAFLGQVCQEADDGTVLPEVVLDPGVLERRSSDPNGASRFRQDALDKPMVMDGVGDQFQLDSGEARKQFILHIHVGKFRSISGLSPNWTA